MMQVLPTRTHRFCIVLTIVRELTKKKTMSQVNISYTEWLDDKRVVVNELDLKM